MNHIQVLVLAISSSLSGTSMLGETSTVFRITISPHFIAIQPELRIVLVGAPFAFPKHDAHPQNLQVLLIIPVSKRPWGKLTWLDVENP